MASQPSPDHKHGPQRPMSKFASQLNKSGLRVVIVGGGIGSLVFANCLQHAGIDHVIIEKRDVLDPQVGGSIGLQPNAARILDELGCFEEISNLTMGLDMVESHRADGSRVGKVTDSMKIVQQRTGYPVVFLDRQMLLRLLARCIDPACIRLSTTVQSIEQYPDKAVVQCTDGTTLEADIVVGADGVHSTVRNEMWRHAELNGDGWKLAEDKKALSAEYKCLFGISNPIPGLLPGRTNQTFAKDVSTLSYIGKGGRVFWFVFVKLDKVYHPPDLPKFTEKDVEDLVREHGSIALTKDATVVVADLYRNKVAHSLVTIEEGSYQHWSYGRLVCLGDAIHKMTPHLGAGASSAMDSAVVLANRIVKLASNPSKPSISDLREQFQQYYEERAIRVERAMELTNKLTRIQALQSIQAYIWLYYVIPNADDIPAEITSDYVIGGPLLDYLPVPPRSLTGNMPFNPKQGWGFKESLSARTRRALPLLAVALFSLLLLNPVQFPAKLLQNTLFQPLYRNVSTMFASETDSTYRSFALAISADATYALWLLESTRLNNKLTLAQIPILFCLVWQILGQGFAAPIYFFLLYVFTPIEKFRAMDSRVMDISYTWSTGLLIFFLGAVPKFLLLQHSGGLFEQKDSSLISKLTIPRQPLLLFMTAGIQYLVARFVRPSTIQHDRLEEIHRDVPSIRWNTILLTTLTSLSWIVHLSKLEILGFLKQASFSSKSMHEAWNGLLGKEGTLLLLAIGIWLLLVDRDLREAGMLHIGWLKLFLSALFTTICLGPGTLVVIGWLVREEILLNRRHRDAITG